MTQIRPAANRESAPASDAPCEPERARRLNDRPEGAGAYVLYWMQQAQRAADNPALEFAVARANALRKPLLAAFGLTADFPEANARHYTFLLEGLRETSAALRARGIRLIVRPGAPDRVAAALGARAAAVVTDRGYVRVQRAWRAAAARALPVALYEVETDAVAPVDLVSGKEEYAARTIRPRIHRHWERFLRPGARLRLRARDADLDPDGGPDWSLDDVPARVRELGVDASVPPTAFYRGGAAEAQRRLEDFARRKLAEYETLRNEPSLDRVSHLSPYLHFGQISPVAVACAVRAADAPRSARDAFLEELIVRRELSLNFTERCPAYDRYEGLPAWARATLAQHAADPREYHYTADRLEAAATHDPYWNAAQREMVITGKMHNYMRMYWGKKIIEWSRTPEEAFAVALRLNNRYELDGRDPNSFAGVAWCFGKHDRPWTGRPVFGNVRYMNAAGLDRKLDMPSYVEKIRRLASDR